MASPPGTNGMPRVWSYENDLQREPLLPMHGLAPGAEGRRRALSRAGSSARFADPAGPGPSVPGPVAAPPAAAAPAPSRSSRLFLAVFGLIGIVNLIILCFSAFNISSSAPYPVVASLSIRWSRSSTPAAASGSSRGPARSGSAGASSGLGIGLWGGHAPFFGARGLPTGGLAGASEKFALPRGFHIPSVWPDECVRLDMPVAAGGEPAAGRRARERWQAPFDAIAAQREPAAVMNLTLPSNTSKIAILSTWCGLATFSHELREAMLALGYEVDIISVWPTAAGIAPAPRAEPVDGDDGPLGVRKRKTRKLGRALQGAHGEGGFSAGPEVVFVIVKENLRSYLKAARFIREQAYDFLFVQHEYGIFYPPDAEGDFVLQLLSRVPGTTVISTLHTILDKAAWRNEEVFVETLRLSDAAISMSASGCAITSGMVDAWQPPAAPGPTAPPPWKARCEFVPHGVPDMPFCDTKAPLKRALGFKPTDFVLLSGGLLTPGKGIGYVIAALPRILAAAPHVKLLICGQPHPDVGRRYVMDLEAHAESLGLRGSVFFLTRHLASADLHRVNAAADAALFMHLDGRQRSSGTMIMAMSAGTVPIGTPFAQAAELLSRGDGLLVPFKDSDAIADAVLRLVQAPNATDATRLAAYHSMRERTWPAVAAQYLALAARGRDEKRGAAAAAALARASQPAALPGAAPALISAGREDRQLPRPGYYSPGRPLVIKDTLTYALIDNGLIAIEASRPTEELLEYRTGLHMRRSHRLGRTDYVMLAGCMFVFTIGGERREYRIFDSDLVFQLLQDPAAADAAVADGGGSDPKRAVAASGTLRQTQMVYHRPAEGAADIVVAVAQRDATVRAGSNAVQVDYSLFLHDSAQFPGGPMRNILLTIGVDQLAAVNSFLRWFALGVTKAGEPESAEQTVMAASNTFESTNWGNLRVLNFYYTSTLDDDEGCTYKLRVEFPQRPAQHVWFHRDDQGRFNYLQVISEVDGDASSSGAAGASFYNWGPWRVVYSIAAAPYPGTQADIPDRCTRFPAKAEVPVPQEAQGQQPQEAPAQGQ